MGEGDETQALGPAQHQDGGVGVEAARPSGTEGDGDHGKSVGAHPAILKVRAGP